MVPLSTSMNTMSAHWMSRKPAVSGLPPNIRLPLSGTERQRGLVLLCVGGNAAVEQERLVIS